MHSRYTPDAITTCSPGLSTSAALPIVRKGRFALPGPSSLLSSNHHLHSRSLKTSVAVPRKQNQYRLVDASRLRLSPGQWRTIKSRSTNELTSGIFVGVLRRSKGRASGQTKLGSPQAVRCYSCFQSLPDVIGYDLNHAHGVGRQFDRKVSRVRQRCLNGSYLVRALYGCSIGQTRAESVGLYRGLFR